MEACLKCKELRAERDELQEKVTKQKEYVGDAAERAIAWREQAEALAGALEPFKCEAKSATEYERIAAETLAAFEAFKRGRGEK